MTPRINPCGIGIGARLHDPTGFMEVLDGRVGELYPLAGGETGAVVSSTA
jgi:hypothetical protein